jgi:hypothetical protein
MSGDYRPRPPVACRWLLRLASLIVPPDARARWRHRREASLYSLWILAERGELPGEASPCLAWLCRDALANAFRMRCGGLDPRRWIRGPAFVMAAAAAALLLIAACTRGFAVTRSLLDAALAGAATGAQQDRLMANLFPVAFALATGTMAAISRVSLRGHSWRYLSFLLLKTLWLAAIVSLLWIEGGAAFRASMPNATLRIFVGGFALAVVFIGTFGWAVMWSLADQQHRCPACLRRLVMPVRIGSWASVFEPVTTEWVCQTGHGLLYVREIQTGEPDCWIGRQPELTDPASTVPLTS